MKRSNSSGPPCPQCAALRAELRQVRAERDAEHEELKARNTKLLEMQRELEQACRRLADLYDYAPVGYVVLDGNGCIREANLTAASEMLGTERREAMGQPLIQFVRNEDRRAFLHHLTQLRRGTSPVTTELMLAHKGGRNVPVQMRSGRVKTAEAGARGKRFRTTLTDISERKRMEEEIRSLAKFPSENPNPILRLSREGVVLYANEASEPLLRMWRCTVGGVVAKPWRSVIADTFAGGQPGTAEVECNERVYSFVIVPLAEAGYVNLYGRDVTDRKRREERIARLTSLYAVLSRANEAIVRIGDEPSLFREVCRIVAEEGGFPVVWIGQVEGHRVVPVASSGPAQDYLKEIKVETEGKLGNGPTGTCIRENCAVVNDDFATNRAASPWKKAALRHDLRASAALPLRREGKAVGALTLYATQPGVFDAEQIALLESLSADLSYALDALDREKQRVRAEQALGEANDHLKQQARELAVINERLQAQTEELRVQAEELTAANEELRVSEEHLLARSQELEAARDEAQNERLRLEAMMDALPVGVAITDAKGGVIRSNGAFKQVWGGPPPKTQSVRDYGVYSAWWADTGKALKPSEWASARAVRKGESTVGQLVRIRRFDGADAFVLNSASPVRDSRGKIVGSAVAIQDVTDLRQAQEALRQSEQRYRTVADFTYDWEFWIGPDGRYEYTSPSAERIVGMPVEETVGAEELLRRIVHPDDLPERLTHLRQETKGGDPCDMEFRIVRPDGQVRWIHHVCQPIRDSQGRFLGTRGSNRDITDRKEAAQALRESEGRYRSLFDDDLTGDFIAAPDGRILFCNPAFVRIHGFANVVEALATNMADLHLDRQRWSDLLEVLRERKSLERYDCAHRHRDGSVIYTVENVVGTFNERGKLTEIKGYIFDDTKRRLAEDAIKDSEERLRLAVESAQLGTWDFDPVTRRLDWSPRCREIFGLSPDIPLDYQTFFECVHPDDRERMNEEVERALAPAGSGSLETEYRICRPDGAERWILGMGKTSFGTVRGRRRAARFIGTALDITERKRAEAIRLASVYNRSLIEASLDPLVTIGPDGKITDVNSATELATGCTREELIGTDFSDYFTEPDKARTGYQRVFKEGSVRDYALELCHRDGHVTSVLYNASVYRDEMGNTVGVFAAARDVTERKKAEAALREANETLERRVAERTEAVRRSEERFRLLSETASRLLAADKPQEVVNDLCRDVMAHLDCQAFFNFLVDEQAGRLHLNTCAGIPKKEAKRIEWLDGGIADCELQIADSGHIANPPSSIINHQLDLVASYGIKSYACHPLMAQGKVLGTLSFGAKKRTRFSEDDLSLMKMVADQVAVAIDRIHSRQALENSERELRQFNEQLENLVEQRTEALAETIDRLEEEVQRRARAERELQERSQMLEGFFQHTITPLAFVDRDFNFIRVNSAYARADGKSPNEFVARNHFELYPDKETQEIFEGVVQTKEPYHAYARPLNYPAQSRRDTYWNWLLTPLLDKAGQVQSLVLNLEDVTDRQRAFEELERRAAQLQRLTLELSQAEDRERQRLAQILHDDLQQLLVGAKLHLNILAGKLKNVEAEDIPPLVSQVHDLLNESIERSRTLSHELMPPLLYQGALSDAVTWLGQQMRQTCGLTVEIDARADADVSSDALKSFVYKAAQEMLFNVVKHARVKQAKVQLRRLKSYIRLVVSDEGRGFDLNAIEKTDGFGLFSIQERARLLGGWMKFKSAPGEGSTFVLAIPDNQPVLRTAARSREEKKEGKGKPAPSSVLHRPSSESRRPSAVYAVRVLLVDDHKVMREGVASLLNEQPDIEVIGQAGNGRDAVAMAQQLQPDVIIMDVAMPILGGEEATRRIKSQLPKTRIIGLSLSEETIVAKKMRQAGAECHLSKTDPSEKLLDAIRGQTAGSRKQRTEDGGQKTEDGE